MPTFSASHNDRVQLFTPRPSCRSDVEEGGETVFPAAKEGVDVNRPGFDQLSECGRRGPSVKPKKGDALLFWSLTPEAKPDSKSLHGKGSKPVLGSRII